MYQGTSFYRSRNRTGVVSVEGKCLNRLTIRRKDLLSVPFGVSNEIRTRTFSLED